MIDYIQGDVAELTPASVVLDTKGVGYELNISLNTYSAIGANKQVKLYVHESIREDAYVLFGFCDRQERSLFRKLITVSGIGPSIARMMLSSMTPKELSMAIIGGDVNVLKTIKGIGAKTAERVIVDLKDKIKLEGEMEIATATHTLNSSAQEAVAALVMLGFVQKASEKVVEKILKDTPDASVEKIIKMALKML